MVVRAILDVVKGKLLSCVALVAVTLLAELFQFTDIHVSDLIT